MSRDNSFGSLLPSVFISTYLIVFTILGLLWFLEVKVPMVGTLPGDLLLRNRGRMVYLPFASSGVVAVPLAVIGAWLRKD